MNKKESDAEKRLKAKLFNEFQDLCNEIHDVVDDDVFNKIKDQMISFENSIINS